MRGCTSGRFRRPPRLDYPRAVFRDGVDRRLYLDKLQRYYAVKKVHLFTYSALSSHTDPLASLSPIIRIVGAYLFTGRVPVHQRQVRRSRAGALGR